MRVGEADGRGAIVAGALGAGAAPLLTINVTAEFVLIVVPGDGSWFVTTPAF